MRYEILFNKCLLFSLDKGTKLLEDYQKQYGFKIFAEQQRVLDVLTRKANMHKMIKMEAFEEAFFSLMIMSKDVSLFSRAAFENIKKFPMVIWMEAISNLDAKDIKQLLNNYHKELPSTLIELCIVNLPDEMQIECINKYKNYLKCDDDVFSSFYYAVSSESRKCLSKMFSGISKKDIILYLNDLSEEEVVKKLSSEYESISKVSSDDLIEFILLKARSLKTLNIFLNIYNGKVMECSLSKFKLLFSRYKYLSNYGRYYFDEDIDDEELLDDLELLKLFRDKFHQLGLVETLSLFGNITNYKCNDFTVEVILEFLDIAYFDPDLTEYLNDETIIELIKRFVNECNAKEYTIDDLYRLVKKINVNNKPKIIFDDFIEAIVACGQLLKSRNITDRDELFLELRDKFSYDLLSRCKKDGTFLTNISLNGVFYRLAKGTMPFDKVYMAKTYKGLIYLTKCGLLIDNADYITNFLTDKQLAELNINPVIKWKNSVHRINSNADNLSFIERMGLQLLCYFGRDKAKYLLESALQGNRMENLFDGLNYGEIQIDADGNPKVNSELLDFLFGRGSLKENYSVINKLIRSEIPEFERYFTEFCNNYYETKSACNGILTVKRIVKKFDDIDLPVELKPDEVEFKSALKEMNTFDVSTLNEAIELCKDARDRKFSTIPKVKGTLGDFAYEILDLDDPLAVAVGNLSHCCFVVKGISYSALKHSMRSVNGRTFVVYHNGKFLAQSWVWRNGDVICFDSVESGSARHGMLDDNIKLVDVYKKAARELMMESYDNEDDLQKVKVVTVGKSDFIFDGLEELDGDVPRPLENDVYVYDSFKQSILAGNMPKDVRYGVVGAQYKDPRFSVKIINDIRSTDIDDLDDVIVGVQSLRYRIHNEERKIDLSLYKQILYGFGWYILVDNNDVVESGTLDGDPDITTEYNKYLSKINNKEINNEDVFIKKLRPSIKDLG